MGPKVSHMNIYAMNSIVHATTDDVVSIMRHIRNPSLTKDMMRYELMVSRRVVTEKPGRHGFDEDEEEEEDYITMMSNLRSRKQPPPPEEPPTPPDADADPMMALALAAAVAPRSTVMHFEAFQEVLELFDVHESDMDILYSLFRLTDTRGVKVADVADVLICFTVVTAVSARECIVTALRVYHVAHVAAADAGGQETVNRAGLAHILMLLNSACHYFGDRVMEPNFVKDLSDSVIAAALPAQDHAGAAAKAGDGVSGPERIRASGPMVQHSLMESTDEEIDRLFIPYREYIDLICGSPVVEMMLSVQYQGGVKEKINMIENLNKT